MNSKSSILSQLMEKAESVECGFKHAAALVKHGKIYYWSVNDNSDYYSHAETSLLYKFEKKWLKSPQLSKKKKMSKYNIYIIRVKKDNLALSKPCLHCIEQIKKRNIKKIYYSVENNIVCEKSKYITTRHISRRNRSF